ncbi:MAG: hypothetical protein MJ236_05955 [Clostridia bacterium]|nr:hypothetical protein [Clostridia bacterium]
MPYAIIIAGVTAYRRDFLVIMIAFYIFHSLIKYIKSRKPKYIILAIGSTIISLLIYEPTFFFIVPISTVIYYQNSNTNVCNFKKYLITSFVFGLPIITMIALCFSKGTAIQASTIWESWSPLYEYLGVSQPTPPALIQFLSKSESIGNVSMWHLKANYGLNVNDGFSLNPLLVFGSLLFFAGMYFLTISTPQEVFSKRKSRILSNIYIFQFVCLAPMFSVLSCDFGRTILYVIFTSYFLLYLSERHNIKISMKHIDLISKKTVKLLHCMSTKKRLLLHISVLVLVPFNLWCGISITHPFILNFSHIITKTMILLKSLGI